MNIIKSGPNGSKNLITIAIIALNLTLIVSAFTLLVYGTQYSVVSINLASKQQNLYQNQGMFGVGFVLFILSIPSSIGTYFLVTNLIGDDNEEVSLFCHIVFGLKLLLLAAMVVIYLTLLITTSMLIYYNNHNNQSGYNSLLIAVLVISIFNLIAIIVIPLAPASSDYI